PVCPRDDPHLQGGVVPPTAGLRAVDGDDAGHRGTAGDGAGSDESLVVAVADDVRAAGRGLAEYRAVHGLEDQTAHQRRTSATIRGHDGAAGRETRCDTSGPGPGMERRA